MDIQTLSALISPIALIGGLVWNAGKWKAEYESIRRDIIDFKRQIEKEISDLRKSIEEERGRNKEAYQGLHGLVINRYVTSETCAERSGMQKCIIENLGSKINEMTACLSTIKLTVARIDERCGVAGACKNP